MKFCNILTLKDKQIYGEVYSAQLYVIKFVSDLRQICGFSPGNPVSSINKTDRYDITKILLKEALNTITLTPNPIKGHLWTVRFFFMPLNVC